MKNNFKEAIPIDKIHKIHYVHEDEYTNFICPILITICGVKIDKMGSKTAWGFSNKPNSANRDRTCKKCLKIKENNGK